MTASTSDTSRGAEDGADRAICEECMSTVWHRAARPQRERERARARVVTGEGGLIQLRHRVHPQGPRVARRLG